MSPSPATLDDLRHDIADLLGVDPGELEGDLDLQDVGMDSVRAMLLAERWGRRTGTFPSFAVLASDTRLEAWWHYLGGER